MSRRSLVIAAVLSGLLIGGFVVLRARWTDALLARWQAELAQARPNDAVQLLGRALDGGELGLMLAVAALGAPQPHVADAAYEAISERLDRIAHQPESAAAWPQQLAAELARQTPAFDRPGRRRAADLALKMLTSLHRTAGEDRTRLTAHCRRVVELYDEPAHESTSAATPATDGSSSGVGAPALAPADAAKPDDAARRLPSAAELLSPDHLRALASGDAERLHPCPVDGSSNDRSAADGGVTTARPADANAPSTATEERRHPTAAPPDRTGAAAAESGRDSSAAALRPMSLGSTASGAGGPLPTGRDESSEKAGRVEAVTEVRDLIGLLRGAEAQAARSELQRRGFGPVELALAEKMIDPDPHVRKQLARLLPQMTSIEPHRWLLWMCRDEDAEVRLTAISLLATCGNPAVLAEVERLAATDADTRVRRCGEQISARRAAVPDGPALR